MASQPRSRGREPGRRLNVRTLVIASVASLTAALVTSRLWIAGTPLAAATTPVLVALVSELLERPAVAVGRRLTADRPALLSAPGGQPGSRAGGGRPAGGAAPVTVYGRRRRVRRRLAVGAVVATGALGFAAAAAAMTLPELVAGRSLGQGDRQTTLFGGKPRDPQQAAPTTSGETAPTSATETETTPTSATETTPSATATTPAPQQQPDYQPHQGTTPQSAPPTATVPAPAETGRGSAQQPER